MQFYLVRRSQAQLSGAISAVSTAIAATPASADTLGGLSLSGQFILVVPALALSRKLVSQLHL